MKVLKAYMAPTPDGTGLADYYLKSEADKVIADLEESHKKEVEQLLMEIVKLNESAQNLILDNYLKDKKLRHSNYKRCLAMAKECVNGEIKLKRVKMRDMNNHQFWQFDNDYWQKWNTCWLKLAEKFKEVI